MLAVALVAVALALSNGLLASLGHNPQFSFTLAGAFAIYLATRPARREIVLTLALGLALRVAYGATFVVEPYFGSMYISFAGFAGIASLMALSHTAFRKSDFSVFGVAAFFPLVSILVGFILPITNRLSPVTFDTHLLAVDGALGFQPSFVLGSMINGRRLLWDLTCTVYYALPFAVALLCASQLRTHFKEVRRLLYLFGAMSALGFCLYAICPATGPIYAFHGWFPSKPPRLSDLSLAVLTVPGAVRNAIPSLHFSTALLVFWNTSGMRKIWRIASGLFLAATGFAILALGEHYVIDMVVAVPFCLMCQAASESLRDLGESAGQEAHGTMAMWIGAGLVAGWLLMLRFGIQPLVALPMATCALFISTVGVSLLMRHRLCRAAGTQLMYP